VYSFPVLKKLITKKGTTMTDEKFDAINLLEKVLASQPNLLSYASTGTNDSEGKKAAEFCIGFIETYSAWLEKQS
jgi:hypothetical protein